MISSAYNYFNKLIDQEYDVQQWNIYGFHFSDGDNWSGGDTDKCISLLKTNLLRKVNLFCYGQVASHYGDGDFIKTKCRLRWYDPDIAADPTIRTAFLEIKHKIGQGRRKSRARVVVDRGWLDTASLDHPRFREILSRDAPSLGEWLPSALVPAAVVRYRRRRFICPFTLSRICLDTGIGLGRVNERLLPRLGQVGLATIVLEVKDGGAAQIPWLSTLYGAGIRQRSFSKYGACIASLLKEA